MSQPDFDAQTSPSERRLEAFWSDEGPEIFHAIASQNEIWKRDPLDVESIHFEARDRFAEMVEQATTAPESGNGRILLLLGEPGSGKTHLVRAFRTELHGVELGYFAYMQMTSHAGNYDRYVASNMIESLDHPYDRVRSDRTGLERLSDSLVACGSLIARDEIDHLRDEPDSEVLADLVFDLTERLVTGAEKLARLDQDLIRALLYLQRNDPSLRASVLKYLRCEDLDDAERRRLGDLVPRTDDHHPQLQIQYLSQVVNAVEAGCTVFCLDQFEDRFFDEAGAEERFREAMKSVRAVSDRVPSSIIIISCLVEYYDRLKTGLANSFVDRIERDPVPVLLVSTLTPPDIERLVARRLAHLYRSVGAPLDPRAPLEPFQASDLSTLAGRRIRDVVDACRVARERSQRERALPWVSEESALAPAPEIELAQLWNDHRAAGAQAPPDDEHEKAALVAWALEARSEELPAGPLVRSEVRKNHAVVVMTREGEATREISIAICDRPASSDEQVKQMTAAQNRAFGRTLVVIRSADFRQEQSWDVAMKAAEIKAEGGRCVAFPDSSWRTLMALKTFREEHRGSSAFERWLREERPLLQMAVIQMILGED